MAPASLSDKEWLMHLWDAKETPSTLVFAGLSWLKPVLVFMIVYSFQYDVNAAFAASFLTFLCLLIKLPKTQILQSIVAGYFGYIFALAPLVGLGLGIIFLTVYLKLKKPLVALFFSITIGPIFVLLQEVDSMAALWATLAAGVTIYTKREIFYGRPNRRR